MNPSQTLKKLTKHYLELLKLSPICTSRRVLKTATTPKQGGVQIVIPYRTNWPLTENCVIAFRRRTRRDHVITVVVNYTQIPNDSRIWSDPQIQVISHDLTLLGTLINKFYSGENGSKNNGLALDSAIKHFPAYEWIFMTHNDSAPFTMGWDDIFFAVMGNESIVGNVRDRIRIGAAHTSGTLFSQKKWLETRKSLMPVCSWGEITLDVGDNASKFLFNPTESKKVPVLPNTQNFPEEILPPLRKNYPEIARWAENGTAISVAPDTLRPIFGHMGRGTPRSSGSTDFSKKLPVEEWIDLTQKELSSEQ